MRQITTSTLSNQNLVTALLTHTYTADADRDIFIRLFADQVAGNGTYTVYATVQRLGAGSAYKVYPTTAPAVASGDTSIAFSTLAFPVKNTDVVKVYLTGLAGDTTTPDIITEIWEADYARPITAGQYATNIDASGRVLLQPTQNGVTIPTVTTVTNAPTDMALQSSVDDLKGRLTATRAGYLDNLSAGAVAPAATALSNLVWTDAKAGYLTGAVALEATLTAIKGAGWTTETLVAIDALIDAIKAKTDLLPASPAAVGSAMTLTTGERTSIGTAVWASTTRTLTSFATLVADIATAVWTYATRTLTQSAAQVAASVAGATITIQRGDSLSATITGLGNISTRSKLWWTVKTNTSQADSAARIQIRETAGLLILNGATATTAGQGAITVNNETTGSITIALDEAATTLLSAASGLSYDVQMLTTSGTVTTLATGTCNVVADVTRAIT